MLFAQDGGMSTSPVTIGFLGHGTIANDCKLFLAPELERGDIRIAGAVVRDPAKYTGESVPYPIRDASALDDLLVAADIVVECAGVPAIREHGPAVVASGTPLLLTSVGALADLELLRQLLSAPGELVVTNGAIGGFDALSAAAEAGGIDEISIQTSKLAKALVRPWMSDEERARLESLTPVDGPIELLRGTPRDAIEKFPANVNVTVALAWATRDYLGPHPTAAEQVEALDRSLARVEVRVMADAAATLSSHVIRCAGSAGEYVFHFQNAPSKTNPRTSGFTAMSVVRDLREWIARHTD